MNNTDTKSLINIETRPSNEEIIENFIKHRSNSEHTRARYRSGLKLFFEPRMTNWRKNLNYRAFNYTGHIFDIKKRDILKYFKFLNEHKGISLSTKKDRFNQIRILLIDCIIEYEEYYEKMDAFMFYIYLKEGKGFQWSEHGHKKPITNKNVVFEMEDLAGLLNYLLETNYPKYLEFRTFIETGMRPGEFKSIKLSRVDEDGQVIQLEDDLEMRILSGIGKTGEKAYYITKELAVLLKDYLINTRRTMNLKTDVFFVSQFRRKYSRSSINNHLKQILEKCGISKRATAKTFRKTINTLRKKMGCKKEDRKILLNHKQRDVNFQSYVKLRYNDFIELYDKWNPYKLLFKI